MASGQVEVFKIQAALEQLSVEASRKELSGNKIHFVPINITALNLALKDKLVFTEPEAQTLAEKIEEITNSRMSEKDKVKQISEIKKSVTSLIDIQDLKNKLCNFIVNKHTYKIIQKGGKFYNETGDLLQGTLLSATTPAVVYENSINDNNIIGALYASFDKSYRGLFQDFLNKQISKFLNKDIYKDTNFREGFDVGHVLGDTSLTTTPLAEKLKKVIGYIDSVFIQSSLVEQTKLTQLKQSATGLLNNLYEQSSYGPRIEATLSQDTRTALLSAEALIVIIQERVENQYNYGSLIEGVIGKKITELIAQLGFSKSIVETIELRVHEVLKHGKVISKGKLGKKLVKTKQQKTKPASITTSKGGSSTKLPKKSLPKPIHVSVSLTALQNLLNASLVQQVKQNMGSGNRRDILNLRSGRFAESVEATKVSQSKQGAITVFYRYMKNPYATFSQGGKQQYPRSRDPKLLISKSIRELAQQQMITKLRTVVQ